MGRAVAMLMDRELISVFGEQIGDKSPVFAQRATEQLEMREAKIGAREREVDTDKARMSEWSEHLRRLENDLEARELRAESVSKLTSRHTVAPARIGRNDL